MNSGDAWTLFIFGAGFLAGLALNALERRHLERRRAREERAAVLARRFDRIV